LSAKSCVGDFKATGLKVYKFEKKRNRTESNNTWKLRKDWRFVGRDQSTGCVTQAETMEQLIQYL